MLKELYADEAHVHILQDDALALSPDQILNSTGGIAPYFVVSNLPYYITSPLLRHFLEAEPAPERMVVTIQLDVAQRIIAKPPQMSILAVAVQAYAQPVIVRRTAARSLHPTAQSALSCAPTRPSTRLPWYHQNNVSIFLRLYERVLVRNAKRFVTACHPASI